MMNEPSVDRLIRASDLIDLENRCKNAQDAVIPRLLFEGVYGKGLCELRNLRKNDVDSATNSLILRSGVSNHRQLPVSRKCIDLCLRASTERYYHKGNGDTYYDYTSQEQAPLVQSHYVIRQCRTNSGASTQVGANLITDRLSKIDDLTPTTVRLSGMLYMAYRSILEYGALTQDFFSQAASRFQVGVKYLEKNVTVEKVRALYKLPNDRPSSDNEDQRLFPKWVTSAMVIGAFGELIAETFLRRCSQHVERVSGRNSAAGYDIKVTSAGRTIAYEVKTSKKNHQVRFFLSSNELKVAEQLQHDYVLFLVSIDEKSGTITGYSIDDPVNRLKVYPGVHCQMTSFPWGEMQAHSLWLQLSTEYFTSLHAVDLTQYRDEVLASFRRRIPRYSPLK